MKPEVLLKAFVLHQSEDGFRELVASTVDEVYSRAVRIVKAPPHLVEEVVLRVYWEMARKTPRLGKRATVAVWLREHTCRAAVRVLHEADRSVDRAALAREKWGVTAPDELKLFPLAFQHRTSQHLRHRHRRSESHLAHPVCGWPCCEA